MVGIRFCGCEWAPVRGFPCLLWRKTHTEGFRARFPTRSEEDEERQGHRVEQRGVSDSQGKVTVRERRLLKEELGPVDPEARSANTRGWVSVPGSCLGILFEYTLVTVTECQKSVKNFSLLTLRANPSSCLFVLLSPTLGYICYICYMFVKHVKCPWLEMRKTTRRFAGSDSGLHCLQLTQLHLHILFHNVHLFPIRSRDLLPLIYTGASLIDGSVKGQYVTLWVNSSED